MAFRSLYTLDFREPGIHKAQSARPINLFAQKVDKEKWLNFEELNAVTTYTKEEEERLIKNMYKNFYSTDYIYNYCREKPKFECSENPHGLIVEKLEKLFEDTNRKVLPPLPSAYRVNKFMSPNDLRTPLTTYQSDHDRVGYFIIKTNRKRQAERKNQEKQSCFNGKVKGKINSSPGKTSDQCGNEISVKETVMEQENEDSKLQRKYYFIASNQPQQYTFVFDPKRKDVVQIKQ